MVHEMCNFLSTFPLPTPTPHWALSWAKLPPLEGFRCSGVPVVCRFPLYISDEISFVICQQWRRCAENHLPSWKQVCGNVFLGFPELVHTQLPFFQTWYYNPSTGFYSFVTLLPNLEPCFFGIVIKQQRLSKNGLRIYFNHQKLNVLGSLPLLSWSMEQVSGLHVDSIKTSPQDALGEMGIWVKFTRWGAGRLMQHMHVFWSLPWYRSRERRCHWSDGTWCYLDKGFFCIFFKSGF